MALALDALPAERLDDTIQIGPSTIPVRRGLLHLASHLAYHIGQLDYHRRLVTGDSRGVGAMGLPAQPTSEGRQARACRQAQHRADNAERPPASRWRPLFAPLAGAR
ncbi:MAG: hypothetical protein IPN16_16060 [Gemmatimonadetes bacterium]|nr:hypothetical protein [Gemmatimonadota bacterium]